MIDLSTAKPHHHSCQKKINIMIEALKLTKYYPKVLFQFYNIAEDTKPIRKPVLKDTNF